MAVRHGAPEPPARPPRRPALRRSRTRWHVAASAAAAQLRLHGRHPPAAAGVAPCSCADHQHKHGARLPDRQPPASPAPGAEQAAEAAATARTLTQHPAALVLHSMPALAPIAACEQLPAGW
jgi:hypothetical protein